MPKRIIKSINKKIPVLGLQELKNNNFIEKYDFFTFDKRKK